jgi:hypothetical protein
MAQAQKEMLFPIVIIFLLQPWGSIFSQDATPSLCERCLCSGKHIELSDIILLLEGVDARAFRDKEGLCKTGIEWSLSSPSCEPYSKSSDSMNSSSSL